MDLVRQAYLAVYAPVTPTGPGTPDTPSKGGAADPGKPGCVPAFNVWRNAPLEASSIAAIRAVERRRPRPAVVAAGVPGGGFGGRIAWRSLRGRLFRCAHV